MSNMVQAPLDRGALEAVLDPSFAVARTLPAESYTSEGVLEWERRHFFGGSWLCVGRADELSSPGDQRAVRVGTEGVLLVRGGDGELRGFSNTCRHRGTSSSNAGLHAISARSSVRTTPGSTGSTGS